MQYHAGGHGKGSRVTVEVFSEDQEDRGGRLRGGDARRFLLSAAEPTSCEAGWGGGGAQRIEAAVWQPSLGRHSRHTSRYAPPLASAGQEGATAWDCGFREQQYESHPDTRIILVTVTGKGSC